MLSNLKKRNHLKKQTLPFPLKYPAVDHMAGVAHPWPGIWTAKVDPMGCQCILGQVNQVQSL